MYNIARAIFKTLRPAQWVKNGVVMAPLFFALWDRTQHRTEILEHLSSVVLGVLAFCLVSGAVYIMNDLCDLERDRLHPEKRLRPIAAGELPVSLALITFPLVLVAGFFLGLQAGKAFLAVLAVYFGIQVFYSFLLRKVGLVDVFLIATGFVLRAVAGARAAAVDISAWLLLCTFLLALFLALCKRRHEKDRLTEGAAHRAALDGYDLRGLDQYIGIAATATVVCYAIYTQAPETIAKFGTRGLGYTVPFVMFGVFRYIGLMYREVGAGRPEKVLLTDIPMLATMFMYVLSVWIAFYLGSQ